MKKFASSFLGSLLCLFTLVIWGSSSAFVSPRLLLKSKLSTSPYTFRSDSDSASKALKYPMKDESHGLPQSNDYNGGLYLNSPSNIKTDIAYETDSNVYTVTQKMGAINYRPTNYMTQEEYTDYEFKRSMKEYWKQRSNAEEMTQKKKNNLIPPIKINSQAFDRIFGSNIVDIRPEGSAELIFGVNSSFTENPAVSVKQRRITTFDFDEKIQLSLIGKIGDRLKITTNYNTQATFDFENKMKLDWSGGEDDIIKKIEAGNVSLPITSSLISGSQSLFGIKTKLQFGKATITSVISQEKGQKKEINVEGGAQTTKFEIKGDNYEANKHFFLSQYFKDQYDSALLTLPVINSGININKIEVWITNSGLNITDTRNIVALADLGENKASYISNPIVTINANNGISDNTVNSLDPASFAVGADSLIRNRDKVSRVLTDKGFRQVNDFEKVLAAKRLSPTEFTFNAKLGFVSLNTNVNPDQVVGVAYQFTYNGGTYQVGEFSTDGIADPKCLLVKMLKSTNVSPRKDNLLWDLMMKNVYAMGGYQIKQDKFRLDIFYNNPTTGTDLPILPESGLPTTGKSLVQVMNLDHINSSGDPVGDGEFDFLDGTTINAANGRIYFPVREPFGEHLRLKINPNHANVNLLATENKYAYDQLYDSTKYIAQQFPEKNRFKIKGSYMSSSGSEISLNAPNIPENSVIVTAGGVPLKENQDYTVDYNLGKVKIINDGILQSGTPIKISFESNVIFGFQQKTLLGAHMDYRVNKDFTWGATAIRLNERPLMQKVSIGDEPIKNTMLGLDGNFRSELPFITRMIDKLPMYSTKEMSTVAANGEVAALIPGHSSVINSKNDKEGNAYIDDFEGSQTPIDIKSVGIWALASTPQGKNPLWPEGERTDTIFGFNRARLAWYSIDPMFMRQIQNLTPSYYTKEGMSDNYQREIYESEIFPKKESQTGQPVPVSTLDLAYYPKERGPYNYDAQGVQIPSPSGLIKSEGTDPLTGDLKNPSSRWGGIMRKLETNDFEAANVEYVQLWMMDPFNPDLGNADNNLKLTSGELVVQLGNISEDVLHDGKKAFENGLPTSASDQTHPTVNTSWGKMPTVQAIVNAFDNDPTTRSAQDVGLDGLNDPDEKNFFGDYLNSISSISTVAYNTVKDDPSSDNYHYFRGADYDAAQVGTLARYKKFNGHEGNSPESSGVPTSSTTLPTTEDINRDNNLNENEGYFQYRVKISKNDIDPSNVGNNFINSVIQGNKNTLKGTPVNTKWYQIKIPVHDFEAKYGNIEDFKSIRFIRMILRGFDKPVVIRLARVDLIRGEWRKYSYDLASDGEYMGDDNSGNNFDVAAVNYEEHGTKSPVNYVLPPDIEQQLNYGTTAPVHMNEQAMSLKTCNLQDGYANATYKNVNLDVRSYKKLKMYVHAEAQANGGILNDNDLTCFMRLGADYTQNYYEYEVPLKVTAPKIYNNSSKGDREAVWNTSNNMEISFADLQEAKLMRNAAMAAGNASLEKRFMVSINDVNGQHRLIYIKGNPTLNEVKTIMIGVRNPKKFGPDDDGLAKCAEIWVNELRLADFDEKGGWASIAHVTTKLADLGTVTLSGNYSTPGWGSIDKKISERQKETKYQYDISSQLLLHKFLPSNWGINLPLYIGYSQAIIRPQYNPLDPDIYLTKDIQEQKTDSLKNDLKKKTIDETDRNSINFTNVRKERPKGSTRNNIFDIENIAVNYSFSSLHNHSAQVNYYNTRDYRGSIIYGYSFTPKNIQPFKKINFLNKKIFSLIKDFNLTPFPNKYSFIADIDRHYAEKLYRNTTGLDIPLITQYNKKFNMMRSYDLKWDLTKSLKLDFHADNTSRILEAPGVIDTKAEKDSIRDNILKGGNNTMYTQHAKADYTVPINKIPLMDWISASAGYSTDYKWTHAQYSAISLGSFLQNGNQKNFTTQANMITLYNKIPFLKKVNQGIKTKDDSKPKAFSGLKVPEALNKEAKAKADSTKKKEKPPFLLPQYVARSLMMLKNVSLNYTNSEGMSLAGYNDSTHILGMNQGKNGFAPGPGFIFGQQNNFGGNLSFMEFATSKDWLVKNKNMNTPFVTNKTENITGRANMEPLPGLKIELNANRNKSQNNSEFYRWNDTSEFKHYSPTESGNFNMSFNTWKTAFDKIDSKYSTKGFENFLTNREKVSAHLANLPSQSGYAPGYGPTSQATMMFAFLAAYSGKDASTYPLEIFPKKPNPNWRVSYDGLSKVKAFKKIFKTITLSHAYRSSYSFSYTNNLKSNLEHIGDTPKSLDLNGNFMFYEQINMVSISEQLSPLLKVDVTLQNNIQINAEMKKERNLGLSFANNQLIEINSKEYVFGTGYRWKNLVLRNPFKKPAKGKTKGGIKSDLNLKADFSIRQNLTMLRKVAEGITQPTAGQTIYSLKLSADYMITTRITARLFFDKLITNPRVSTSFRSSNTNAGVSFRFSLI